MQKFTALPTQVHTMYAQLLDQCREARFVDDFPATGSFKKVTVKGRDYWYYQSSKQEQGKGYQKQKYVGPDSEKIRALIERHARLKDEYGQRRQIVRAFKQLGVITPSDIAGDLIERLAALGTFRMRACLVGTFAFQVYEGLLGVKFPREYAYTQDLDIAQFREVSIAVAATDKVPSLLEALRTIDPSFEPTSSLERSDPPCRYKNRDGYVVDILVPNRGADKAAAEPLPALGTAGQLLRYLDFLIYQPVEAVALHGGGVLVNVPEPSRFAVHKLIVSRVRPEVPKRAKDLWQASCLLTVQLRQDRHGLMDAFAEALARGPKWIQNVRKGLESLDADLREELRTVLETPVSKTGLKIGSSG
ncbi:MAG: hypothetical protein GXY42_11440 [Desulfovibrionales bacterium]|nr:hypothetical protein [Desulfovibrionales bacterium]